MLGCGAGQQLQLLIQPLAWEPPCAASATLKKKQKKKRKKEEEEERKENVKIKLSSGILYMLLPRLMESLKVTF